MDKNFDEIGKGTKEKTNIYSRGGSLPWFPIQNFLMGGSTPKLAEILT